MNHYEERERRDLRYCEIPQPIRDLSQSNPVVHHHISMFISGQIITIEEMQWQLIRALTLNYEKMGRDFIAYQSLVVAPIHVPKP